MQINFLSLMFIFGLPTLVNYKKKNRKDRFIINPRSLEGPWKVILNIRQVDLFSKNITFITVIPEDYNQQNRSLHLRRLQSAKPLSTSQKTTISSKKNPQGREKESRKKRKRGGEE